MRNTGLASTTRSIGSTLPIGRGRLNWHAALPSRREFAFDAAKVFDDSKNSQSISWETEGSSTRYLRNLRRTSGARALRWRSVIKVSQLLVQIEAEAIRTNQHAD